MSLIFFPASFLLFNQENGKGKSLPLLISSRHGLSDCREVGAQSHLGERRHGSVLEVRLRSSCFQHAAVITACLERQEGTVPSPILDPSSGFDSFWLLLPQKSVLASVFPVSFTGAIPCSVKQFCTCIKQRHRLMWILSRNLYLCLIRSWLLSYQILQMQVHSQGQGLNELRNTLQGKSWVWAVP